MMLKGKKRNRTILVGQIICILSMFVIFFVYPSFFTTKNVLKTCPKCPVCKANFERFNIKEVSVPKTYTFDPAEKYTVVETRSDPHYWFITEPNTYQATYVQKNGFYSETKVMKRLTSLFNPEEHFVLDVGGNVGCVSFCTASFGFRTIALEVMEKNVLYFRGGIMLNNLQNLVKIYNVGVGETSSEHYMCFAKDGNEVGLSKTNGFVFGSMEEVYEFEKRKEVKLDVKPFQITTIDTLSKIWERDEIMGMKNMNQVKVVKMDIEGYEYYALKGGYNFFKEVKPLLFVEINSKMMTKRLSISESDMFKLFTVDFEYTCYDVNRDLDLKKINSLDGFHGHLFCFNKVDEEDYFKMF